MFQELLRDTPLITWPVAAFALFFATFVAVLVAVAASRRKDFDHVASLPLTDDVPIAHSEGGR